MQLFSQCSVKMISMKKPLVYLLATIVVVVLLGALLYTNNLNSYHLSNDQQNISENLEPYTGKQLGEGEIKARQEKLDPFSYNIMVNNGTERPFRNKYWDNKEEGIYVDKVTGEPLFSSTHKFVSDTGWPSFWRSIDENAVTEHVDTSLGMTRTEVRSAGGHLGHLFDDGPQEYGGQRYCINSAALIFVPKDQMSDMGYGDYLSLFENE